MARKSSDRTIASQGRLSETEPASEKFNIRFRMDWETLTFLVLLVAAAAIRIWLIPTTVWSGDPARDLAVTDHILKYREFPVVGHVASGTNPVFFYPPVYYYLLAFLRIPSLSIWYAVSVFVVLNLLSIVFVYRIARVLGGRIAALVTACLYAFSPFYIDRHTVISSMHLSLPLMMGGTYLHLLGTAKKKLPLTVAGLGIIAATSLINYAALILLPVYLIWTASSFRRDFAKFMEAVSVVLTIMVLLSWKFVSYVVNGYGWGELLNPFAPDTNISIGLRFFPDLIRRYTTMVSDAFPRQPLAMGAVLLLVILIAVWKSKEKKTFLYPAGFVVATLVLSAMKTGVVEPYYFYLVLPFFFVLLGLSLPKKISGWKRGSVFSCVVGLCFWSASGNLKLLVRPHSYADTEKSVAAALEKIGSLDPSQKNNMKVDFIAVDHGMWWDSLMYRYLAENMLGKSFRVVNRYNNLNWIRGEDWVVMACHISGTDAEAWCEREFDGVHPGYILVDEIQKTPQHLFLYKKNFR